MSAVLQILGKDRAVLKREPVVREELLDPIECTSTWKRASDG